MGAVSNTAGRHYHRQNEVYTRRQFAGDSSIDHSALIEKVLDRDCRLGIRPTMPSRYSSTSTYYTASRKRENGVKAYHLTRGDLADVQEGGNF